MAILLGVSIWLLCGFIGTYLLWRAKCVFWEGYYDSMTLCQVAVRCLLGPTILSVGLLVWTVEGIEFAAACVGKLNFKSCNKILFKRKVK